MNWLDISTDNAQFYFICALVAVVGALAAYIHQQAVNRINANGEEIKISREKNQEALHLLADKLDRMDNKIDKYELQNAKDHASVEACIVRLSAKVDSMQLNIDRIERDLNYYKNES